MTSDDEKVQSREPYGGVGCLYVPFMWRIKRAVVQPHAQSSTSYACCLLYAVNERFELRLGMVPLLEA